MDMDGEGLADAIKAASNLNEMERSEPERHEAAEQLLGNWEVRTTFAGNRFTTPQGLIAFSYLGVRTSAHQLVCMPHGHMR